MINNESRNIKAGDIFKIKMLKFNIIYIWKT